MIDTQPNTCRECGKALDNTKPSFFCDTGCRVSWRNRRASRGADLYDLFMAMRYDRTEAKELGLWNLMCRMASSWHEEDLEAGRQSYFSPREASARQNHHRATVVGRMSRR
jgi:hypothetical protein